MIHILIVVDSIVEINNSTFIINSIDMTNILLCVRNVGFQCI